MSQKNSTKTSSFAATSLLRPYRETRRVLEFRPGYEPKSPECFVAVRESDLVQLRSLLNAVIAERGDRVDSELVAIQHRLTDALNDK
jgi:hypothetical protein